MTKEQQIAIEARVDTFADVLRFLRNPPVDMYVEPMSAERVNACRAAAQVLSDWYGLEGQRDGLSVMEFNSVQAAQTLRKLGL